MPEIALAMSRVENLVRMYHEKPLKRKKLEAEIDGIEALVRGAVDAAYDKGTSDGWRNGYDAAKRLESAE